tara:strand:- start:729 stop:902 length:174 start_codon:yes stop_codon:yes gene_type:complete
MFPQFIIAKILGMAAKGLLSEKMIKKVIFGLGDLLVKSTKSDLDDKAWKKIKKMLGK